MGEGRHGRGGAVSISVKALLALLAHALIQTLRVREGRSGGGRISSSVKALVTLLAQTLAQVLRVREGSASRRQDKQLCSCRFRNVGFAATWSQPG